MLRILGQNPTEDEIVEMVMKVEMTILIPGRIVYSHQSLNGVSKSREVIALKNL